MERVKTGISGLDQLLQGGFPSDSNVLVSGGNGTGKTIFSMQYVYNGAAQFKEPGIFVTVESNAKSIAWDMQSFNWGIHELQEKKLFNIFRMSLGFAKSDRYVSDKISEQLRLIESKVKEMNATRLVIDSTTAFATWMESFEFRPRLFEFLDGLKDLGCTTLFTSETSGGKTDFSAFGVEEFVADGVIALYFVPPNRSIFVRKMRGTGHSTSLHPFEITNAGILIKPKEQVMWEAIK
ncbi:MAG: KaiC domain-containing protein [Candidatus Diapherotrites archaeon]|uniref:KaiC domain-containing protein n=1 Tax=Candidatus Iainarchaeum sp. TaxID=3101447 RepID=A0A938YY90_9ARCH|nr:KaiC domain-containing protein [Candidatus Diapherotrites archaeon]